MRLQPLISAGFAITALASASVPAVAWTLLGEFAERPTASVQAPWSDAEPIFMAEAAMVRVAFRQQSDEPPQTDADRNTLW